MTVCFQSRRVEPGRQNASIYQTSRAPPGRCSPWIDRISLSQVRDNVRSSSAPASGRANKREPEQPRFRSSSQAKVIHAGSTGSSHLRSTGRSSTCLGCRGGFRRHGPSRGFREYSALEESSQRLDERSDGDADQDTGGIREHIADLSVASHDGQ